MWWCTHAGELGLQREQVLLQQLGLLHRSRQLLRLLRRSRLRDGRLSRRKARMKKLSQGEAGRQAGAASSSACTGNASVWRTTCAGVSF